MNECLYKMTLRAAICGGSLFICVAGVAPAHGAAELSSGSLEKGHYIVQSEQPSHAAALDAARAGGPDSDGDGQPDFADNCVNVPNASQLDTDADGYGNFCDADLDNNGFIDFLDLGLLKAAFFSTPTSPNWDPDADFNGDGTVDFLDLGKIKMDFFGAPGPSGMSCAGTTPCPAARFVLQWPMPGFDADDWVINNYVDLDAGPGLLDYNGGAKTYDGHRGVDIDVSSFREMDADFPILASAQGTVLALEESNFDRNTTCVGSWNFVTVGHPNGWKTVYGHLKMNSVVVSVGQIVNPGDVLGVVGSSGCSTQPHLHLETIDPGGVRISPFQAGLFVSPPVYATAIGFMDAMLYNVPINHVDMLKDPAPNVTIVAPGGTLGTGLSLGGGGPGDVVNMRIVDAGQAQVATTNININQVLRHSYWWWNYNFNAGATGPHQMQIRVNGSLAATYDFHVGPIYTGFRQVRHGVPAASYQGLFNDLVANGYRPIWVDGYDVNGATFFNVIYDQSQVASWAAAHGQDGNQYQTFFNAQTAAGRRLVHIDSYLQGGQMRFASVFVDEPGTAWVSYHGATVAAHQANFNTFTSQGFRPRIISSVQEAVGTQRITALYDKEPVGSFVALANLTSAAYQSNFNAQTAAGRTLAYLDGYTLNGTAHFSAIWDETNPTSWVARHDRTSAQFQSDFDTWTNAGLSTRIVTGYQNGAVANFAGFWSN